MPTTYIEKNMPTTYIEKNMPTTYIEKDSPTTISPYEEGEIPTTYIEKNTLKTILTTYIEKDIPTTYIEKDSPTIIQTTYIEKVTPTTILTTYIKMETLTTNIEIINYNETNEKNYTKNIKCKESSYESSVFNLCISCNIELNYFPAYFPKDDFLHGFTECYNNKTKPINFYFDNSEKKFKPCFETCGTCNEGGNEDNNNCLTCEINFIKKPDYEDTTNCVTKCNYNYYYTPYGQYKCTNNSNCPEEANIYIKDIKKCTNQCKKEVKYIFQYSGQCLENCPKDTLPNEENICIDINLDTCSKSESEINLQEFLTSGGVDINAKNYAKEFGYTKKHVSLYYNDIYSIILYKDMQCIEELSINMPKIEFGDCYSKIKEKLDPPTNDELIIALVEKSNGIKKPTITNYFYHPETGNKIDYEALCKDEEVVIKESVLSQLKNTSLDLNSLLYLTNQNIDIFNLSDAFFTDLCYHFDSPNGKDAPLSERIKLYYPNITLCAKGCISKGVNFSTLESICFCKFNDIMNNEIIEDNVFFQNTIGEVAQLINSSNILVLACYKDIFNIEYFKKGTGGFIIMILIIIEIIFTLIFLIKDMGVIRVYLYNLTENFIKYISKRKKESINNSKIFIERFKNKAPPKKKIKKSSKALNLDINKNIKKEKDKKKIIHDENNAKSINTYKSVAKLTHKIVNFQTSSNLLIKQKKIKNKQDKSCILTTLEKEKKRHGNINIEEYLKPNYDDMEYDDAIKVDHRDFCQFLIAKLMQKQIIMYTFYNKENLNPLSIKIILLSLNIDLYFVINGLFFNENYIAIIFNSEEEETFFSFFPRSISRFFYSVLVGLIIGIIIDCIFIEEKRIKRILLREKEDLLRLKYEISIITKSIKKRYTFFSFISLFITIFSWYYVSCFNNTYPGVKIEWIKSSIAIILIMQILSFLIVFLQSILRSLSFKYKIEKLYKFKQLIS